MKILKHKVLNNSHNFICFEDASADKTFTFCLYEDHYFIHE